MFYLVSFNRIQFEYKSSLINNDVQLKIHELRKIAEVKYGQSSDTICFQKNNDNDLTILLCRFD